MPSDPIQACPRCGKSAPEVATLGLCPSCLFAAGKRPATSETEESQIGVYSLHGMLGEGGFGTVYLAEQSEPFEREVALKILKTGAASTEVARRFEAERQTLARLDHPNIASFIDSGATPSSRPYFVMELVEGSSVTEYCDQKKLSLRARLTLFLDICSALQHAHQKGVIHRDLKPQNILVTEIDGRPVPKVIDFGVAKILEPVTAGAPGTTLVSSILGTPAYMSPEQASGRPDDVDTRTDVYALGVLLYELLSGQLPFDQERLLKLSHAELETILRDEDPPPPSTRAAETASLRGSTSTRIGSKIRGDLDWIVARAMSKTIDRRYTGASAFAEDIRRHLAGETVSAGPPDLRYRAGKFVRKHKAPIISALLILAALLGGLVASAYQAVRATRAETIARAEAAKLANAVLFLQSDILATADPSNNTNREITLKEAIDLGAPKIGKRFGADPATAAFLHGTLASVYHNLGDTPTAIAQATSALDLVEPLPDRSDLDYSNALIALGSIHLVENDLPAARSTFERGLKNFARSDGHPQQIKALEYEGKILIEEGHFAEAETTIKKALAAASDRDWPDKGETVASLYGHLGTLYTYSGRPDEAIIAEEKSIAYYRANYPEDSINLLRSEEALARAYGLAGHYNQSIPILRKNIAALTRTLSAGHPDVTAQKNTLAYHLDEIGQFDEAEALLRENIAAGEIAGTYSAQQLISLENLGILVGNRGDNAESLRLYTIALEGKTKLYGEDSIQALTTQYNYALSLRALGQLTEAEAMLRKTYQGFATATSRAHPSTLRAARSLVTTLEPQSRYTDIAEFLLPALKDLGPLTGTAAEVFGTLESHLTTALEATGDTARLRTHRLEQIWEHPAEAGRWFAVASTPLTRAIGFAGLRETSGRVPREILEALPPAIVPPGAEWYYHDTHHTPPEDWTSPEFDASSWSSGPSELGYGDGDEATTLSFGEDPTTKPVTTYFRHTFEITEETTLPTLLLSCDDGAIAFLDGSEVARIHLPSGPITPETMAIVSVGGALENDFAVFPLTLGKGSHTLAIEIHQDRPSSSDITCLPLIVSAPKIPSTGNSEELPTHLAALLEIHRLSALGDNQSARYNLKNLAAQYPNHKPLKLFDELLANPPR